MTVLTFEHGGDGMPDRTIIEGYCEFQANYTGWHEAEEWTLTVRPSRVAVIDKSLREQVAPVIYDELKRRAALA